MNTKTVDRLLNRWFELERRFLPSLVLRGDPLTFWRERILFIICFLAAVLGPFALIPSTWMAYQEKLWNIILVDSAAYVTALVILLNRSWTFKIRTGMLCCMFYVLGIWLLLALGPVGAGYIWLFGASVIISAILGFEAAVWTLILNAVSFGIVALFMSYGHLPWMSLYDKALEKWLVMSVNFLLMNSFVTLATAMMLNGLSKALYREQKTNRCLQESEEKYKFLVENVNDIIWTFDLECMAYSFCSNSMESILGYTADEAFGMKLDDIFSPETKQTVTAAFRRITKGMDPSGKILLEAEHIAKNGAGVWMEINAVVQKNPSGIPVAFSGVSRDVTKRRQAEEALQQSERRLSDVIDFLPDATLAIDAGKNIIVWNKAIEKMTGIKAEDMMGRGDYAYSVPFFGERRSLLMDLVWENEQNISEKYPYIERQDASLSAEVFCNALYDGRGAHVYVTVSPLHDRNGDIVGAIESIRDITERKKSELEKSRLEGQLLQAQKMESIGSLAGGIAHDLNNILFPISGLSEMLLDELPPDDPNYESIEQIFKSARRGSDLVKQILAFSRQSNPQKLPIRIQSIIKEVLKLIRSTIPTNIGITSHVEPDCGMVSADPSQVHQILMNLITNAYHAVEKNNGSIHIRLKEAAPEAHVLYDSPKIAKQYACIVVSDTGTGIEQSVIDKIFDPYFTTKEQGKGTGLGLSVVHGIVKEHGGTIHVSSEAGRGTSVYVYLPLLDRENAITIIDAATAYPTGRESILLVDDEEPIAKMIQVMLEKLGYRVTSRTSSPDALNAFRTNPSKFDLVISDRGMPNMTGEQLARQLISIRPEIPIIMCTGFSDLNDEKRAMEMGIRGFLKKPVARADLAETVRKVLDKNNGDM